MVRYCVMAIIVGILFMFSAAGVSAQAPEVTIFVEESRLELDVPPIIEDGRTLVPMRAALEALGSTVDWNGEEQKITAEKDGFLTITPHK